METMLPVTALARTLVPLGFSGVLPRRAAAAAQVDVKADVPGQRERFNTGVGQKTSVSTADMASRSERLEVRHG
jgi:hypothetical protein